MALRRKDGERVSLSGLPGQSAVGWVAYPTEASQSWRLGSPRLRGHQAVLCGPPFGMQMAAMSLPLHVVLSLCTWAPGTSSYS